VDALELLQSGAKDLPFVVVSRTLETAVEAIKRGATDYVLKQHLTRLPHTVRRALAEKSLRRERDRASAAPSETSQTLEAVIQASPLAIYARDLEKTVTMWNPAAERMFGWSKQEVLGRPLPFIPEDKVEEYSEFAERAVRGDVSADFETKMLRKDGFAIDVSLSYGPLCNAAGNITGLMAVAADVTERKLLEEQLRQAQKSWTACGRHCARLQQLADDDHGVHPIVNRPPWRDRLITQSR
jgi:PAS domain S-box-containing protein